MAKTLAAKKAVVHLLPKEYGLLAMSLADKNTDNDQPPPYVLGLGGIATLCE